MGDPTRPVALWRDRTFRFIWGGQTASLFGDQVTNLALPWLLLHQTHSAFAAGAVSAARYLPLLTFGLAAGLIADRIERRALMIGADVGRLVALGAVALVGVLGRVPPLWLLVLVVLVLGTGQLLFGVAYGAWLPDVTGDERLARPMPPWSPPTRPACWRGDRWAARSSRPSGRCWRWAPTPSRTVSRP